MRNHELIALGDPIDYWNYHLDQQSTISAGRQHEAAGIAAAYNAVEYHKQLKQLQYQVTNPDFLLEQLALCNDSWNGAHHLNDTTHLKALGEVIYKIWDRADDELSHSTVDELKLMALRLVEMSGEIEQAREDMVNDPNYDDGDYDEDND